MSYRHPVVSMPANLRTGELKPSAPICVRQFRKTQATHDVAHEHHGTERRSCIVTIRVRGVVQDDCGRQPLSPAGSLTLQRRIETDAEEGGADERRDEDDERIARERRDDQADRHEPDEPEAEPDPRFGHRLAVVGCESLLVRSLLDSVHREADEAADDDREEGKVDQSGRRPVVACTAAKLSTAAALRAS